MTTPAAPSGRYVDHDGYRTWVITSGERNGEPLVLLIHGSGPGVSAEANWRTTMTSSLARSRAFVAPDLIGFGKTPAGSTAPLTHEARVAHLISFLDAYDEGPYDIIGNSLGGALALAVAARRPDQVRRMVLMGTVGIAFPITNALDRVWGYEPSLANMRELLDLFVYDRSMITNDLVALRYEASADAAMHAQYAAAFAAPRQRHVDAMALPEDVLRRITTPTLLVHGAADRVIPLDATSRRLVELLPNADLVVFGRCGHWTQIERASDFQRHVGMFL